jgi:phosphoribosylglycinamide formyltransferase-1
MASNSKICIFASGDGSNFEAIVEAARSQRLYASVCGLIVNKHGIRALARAARLQIPAEVISRKDFGTAEDWNRALCKQAQAWQANWIVLAGFTGLIGSHLLQAYPNRIVNSHPSLLPKFGGKGMYGNNVHAAVVAAGEVESGITVHLLNERFDEGPILAQHRVALRPGDTAETLAERIKCEERKFYPEALQDLLTGRIKKHTTP